MIAALTGLIAGAVHVWAGPDHLAAVAPLAVHKRQRRAWVLGARWGLGHSAGVAVVGLVFLWLRDLIPVELLSSWGERLVGVLLVGIGLWGLRKAFSNHIHTHEHEHDGERHIHVHVHSGKTSHDQPESHGHTHAAFGIGVLHGVAGSSHFLGVLPVLAFPTLTQAFSYVVMYAAGTILSMGLFSAIVSLVAARFSLANGGAYRGLMGLSSVSALVIGGFWLLSGTHSH
jgi:ABC-type nickel/cobalt efflux system permease component RcnA